MKMYEEYFLKEDEQVEIPVEHPGLLEVPEGEKVENLPFSHFLNLANKKGFSKVSKGLINLKVWNRNRDKELSSWADKMQERLSKHFENK